VLASGSPQRQALLREHGYDFDVVVSPIDEPTDLPGATTPAALARGLSLFKAECVRKLVTDAWILSGDTVVALNSTVFGKPINRDDARRIIKALSGTTQDVVTGVTLLDANTARCRTAHDTTRVTMRRMADDEIEAYLDTDAWDGKAGAYGIQDLGDAFITRVDGSFTNVVGFPMELVAQMLTDWGMSTPHLGR
jgi:septum formation protein